MLEISADLLVHPFSAFLVGLLSAVHCVGMCGGVVTALTFGLGERIRQNRWRRSLFVIIYSLGRILSYSFAGFIVASLGQALFDAISPQYGHLVVTTLAAVVMVGLGLYLSGLFSAFRYLDNIGKPLWAMLAPIGKKLVPVHSLPQAFVYGIVWGWLPCGLVYSVLLITAGAGSGSQGAITMLFFGLGTMPAIVGAGLLAGQLTEFLQKSWVRRLAGVSIILLASYLLYTQFFTDIHAGHQGHTADQVTEPQHQHHHH